MIVNNLLYVLSGFCFGIFASRFSLLSFAGIMEAYKENGLAALAKRWHLVLFLLGACFIFPVWFIGRTTVGGFTYYAVLIYFFNKGYSAYKTGKADGSPVPKNKGKKANKWR